MPETGALRIRSSAPIRGISAIEGSTGLPEILLPNHRLGREWRPIHFDSGWIESFEVRSDRGEAVQFVRVIVTPRYPVRYRLRTLGDTAWLQIADEQGEWLPIGPGRELFPAFTLPSPKPLRLRTTAGVSLRAGPGTDRQKIGAVGIGQVVLGLERAGDWVRVETEGREGWIHGDFLEPAPSLRK